MNKNYLLKRIEAVEKTAGSDLPNESTLLKFSESTGELYWDGSPVAGSLPQIEIVDVNGLPSALDGKADVSHTQAISTVTGLGDALDGKADTSHTQGISTITGLSSALSAKADVTQLHSHANKAVLDDLGDATGSLTYKGSTVGGGGGVSTFSALTDTPSTMVGNAGKMTVVNTSEDALEYIDVPAGGGGGATLTTGTFTMAGRSGWLNSATIYEHTGTWIDDGNFIRYYYELKWVRGGSDAAMILIGLPKVNEIDFLGLSNHPMTFSIPEVRPPYYNGGTLGPVFASIRDNGWIEVKGTDANYLSGKTYNAVVGISVYACVPKL